jgi:hypothetical protein
VTINNRLTALFVCCTVLAALMLSIAEAAARTNRIYRRAHYRDAMQRSAGCPTHKNAYGELIDCRGWRLWSGSIGWDNTCFKSLDYLPGEYACSSAGSRR